MKLPKTKISIILAVSLISLKTFTNNNEIKLEEPLFHIRSKGSLIVITKSRSKHVYIPKKVVRALKIVYKVLKAAKIHEDSLNLIKNMIEKSNNAIQIKEGINIAKEALLVVKKYSKLFHEKILQHVLVCLTDFADALQYEELIEISVNQIKDQKTLDLAKKIIIISKLAK